MSPATCPHLIRRLALATCLVALLPIGMGALVTTMDWGMAFLDWPSSDGHGMFAYPWLESLALGARDKFGEHGHRLAGIVIGLFGLALAGAAWFVPCPERVRRLAFLVLAGIVVQGLLGGQRVLFDARTLAAAHAVLAVVVFGTMVLTVQVASPGWTAAACGSTDDDRRRIARHARFVAGTALALGLQYVLGTALRHFGTALHEHMGGAVLLLLAAVALFVSARRTGHAWLVGSSWAVLAAVGLQILLGLGAFATKFGLASIGHVAVQHAPEQVVLRTAHTVAAMFVAAALVVHAARTGKLARIARGTAAAAAAVECGSVAADGIAGTWVAGGAR